MLGFVNYPVKASSVGDPIAGKKSGESSRLLHFEVEKTAVKQNKVEVIRKCV